MPTVTRTSAEQIAHIVELRAEYERVGNEPATAANHALYMRLQADIATAERVLAQIVAATNAGTELTWTDNLPIQLDAPVRLNVEQSVPEPVSEADDSETEAEQHDCDACREPHDVDDMVCVINSSGYVDYARAECVERDGSYVAPDYLTRQERNNSIEYVHVDQTVTAEDDSVASDDYARENWYYSRRAETWYSAYELSPEYDLEHDPMYEYDTDVIDIHGWPSATPADGLCFGVELECESVDNDAEELCTALGGKDGNGTYILKSDGSLDNGTELVTLPYTLDYHQARFDWARVLRKAQPIANSGSGTTSCGIHVHINRKAISALTLGKMLVFVNDPRNVKAITGVAQRSESSWAKFHAKKLTDGMHGKYADERYQALNVRPNTVEVRIFKGNLNPKRILKNLEFCHALVMYCRTASMQHLTWEQFWHWLRASPANRKQYGHLIDFAHGLLSNSQADTEKDI